MMDNLSVLIGTCDAYCPLWKNFSICFNRYWKHRTRNIFVGETISVPSYGDTKFETILCDKDRPWGERMLAGIEMSSDYIFFIVEDFFLSYSYLKQQLDMYVEDMKLHKMNRLQISRGGPPGQNYVSVCNINYDRIADNSKYLISMQPSIWSREFLLRVLKPEYSPWDFEIEGSYQLRGKEKNTYIDRFYESFNVYFPAARSSCYGPDFRQEVGWEDFRKRHHLKDF